jgi:IS30 family transposase
MEWTAMDRTYARGFNAAAREELWDRWQHGESLKAIGRALGKPSSSIYFQVAPHGGIRPARRRRSRLALTLNEREEISLRRLDRYDRWRGCWAMRHRR